MGFFLNVLEIQCTQFLDYEFECIVKHLNFRYSNAWMKACEMSLNNDLSQKKNKNKMITQTKKNKNENKKPKTSTTITNQKNS